MKTRYQVGLGVLAVVTVIPAILIAIGLVALALDGGDLSIGGGVDSTPTPAPTPSTTPMWLYLNPTMSGGYYDTASYGSEEDEKKSRIQEENKSATELFSKHPRLIELIDQNSKSTLGSQAVIAQRSIADYINEQKLSGMNKKERKVLERELNKSLKNVINNDSLESVLTNAKSEMLDMQNAATENAPLLEKEIHTANPRISDNIVVEPIDKKDMSDNTSDEINSLKESIESIVSEFESFANGALQPIYNYSKEIIESIESKYDEAASVDELAELRTQAQNALSGYKNGKEKYDTSLNEHTTMSSIPSGVSKENADSPHAGMTGVAYTSTPDELSDTSNHNIDPKTQLQNQLMDRIQAIREITVGIEDPNQNIEYLDEAKSDGIFVAKRRDHSWGNSYEAALEKIDTLERMIHSNPEELHSELVRLEGIIFNDAYSIDELLKLTDDFDIEAEKNQLNDSLPKINVDDGPGAYDLDIMLLSIDIDNIDPSLSKDAFDKIKIDMQAKISELHALIEKPTVSRELSDEASNSQQNPSEFSDISSRASTTSTDDPLNVETDALAVMLIEASALPVIESDDKVNNIRPSLASIRAELAKLEALDPDENITNDTSSKIVGKPLTIEILQNNIERLNEGKNNYREHYRAETVKSDDGEMKFAYRSKFKCNDNEEINTITYHQDGMSLDGPISPNSSARLVNDYITSCGGPGCVETLLVTLDCSSQSLPSLLTALKEGGIKAENLTIRVNAANSSDFDSALDKLNGMPEMEEYATKSDIVRSEPKLANVSVPPNTATTPKDIEDPQDDISNNDSPSAGM